MIGLSEKFRVVLVDEDTLKELKSYRLSKTGMMLGMGLGFVLLAGLLYSILFFTPMRYLVPGYGDINSNKVYVELNQKIQDLEKLVAEQQAYTQGLRGYFNPTGQEITALNSGETAEQISIRQEDILVVFAIVRRGVAVFDPTKEHYGIDIVASAGSSIKAIQSGIVVNTDWSNDTGHTITLLHDHGIVSIYKHNSKLLSKLGEHIVAGSAIAIIGNTGERSTGPHLHLELWKREKVLDPNKYIRFD